MKRMQNFIMLTLLMIASTISAQTITYSLTTHVDNRTITKSVSVSSSADIASKFPKEMKRAYCTYYFFWDKSFNEPVDGTEALSGNKTVYVDYDFDPPFIISSGNTQVSYFLTTWNNDRNSQMWLMCDNNNDETVATWYPSGGSANPGAQTDINPGKLDYYLEGDAYALAIRNRKSNKYIYKKSGDNIRAYKRTTKYSWELYENSNVVKGHNTVSIGTQTDDGLFSSSVYFLENTWNGNTQIRNNQSQNNDGQITATNVAWWFELSINGNKSMYQYRIYKNYGDGSLRAVTRQDTWAKNKKPADDFTKNFQQWRIPAYTYRFFKDEAMTQEYGTDETIPETKNGVTVVYVLETPMHGDEYVTDHWITVCLPYTIAEVDKHFGKNKAGDGPAVRVLEYTGCDVNETCATYQLQFKQVNKMEAHKPYLFKADEVLAKKYLLLYDTEEAPKESDVIPVGWQCMYNGAAHEKNVWVDMIGTYDGITLEPSGVTANGEEEFIYFYLGYKASTDEHNFYKVKKAATINPFRCYFKIYSKNETQTVSILSATFSGTITGITEPIEFVQDYATPQGVYNMNGQLIRTGNDIEGLSRGLYIVDGKKIVIR